jgi:hypothetical protein
VKTEVINILTQSDRWSEMYKRIGRKVRILSSAPRRADELGLTGRIDLNNRDLVGIQYAWGKINSRFELASLHAHELTHANQILNRGYTLGEAAPFLTLMQYIVSRWASEFEAFNFQALVLKDIVQTMPVFAPCVKPIRAECVPVRLLQDGHADLARENIAGAYDVWRLAAEHRRESNVSPEERARLQDVKNKVDGILRSDYPREETKWSREAKSRGL